MKKYIKYLKYVLRHKWYVMIECFGRGLYWRGIMHDMSKLRLSEFIPYAKYFYEEKRNCWNCKHIIENGGQCDINWAGIGDGKQAPKCEEYIEKGIEKGRKNGSYRAGETINEQFNYAWLLHQKRNKHHWQYWVLPLDDGGTKIFKMPGKYIDEMICDWNGAGMAISGKNNTKEWYGKNKWHMQLNPRTRYQVETSINYI